jgi:hypothetical protein
MTRSTSPKNLVLLAAAFLVFAFAPGSALAQHGGGGHAGGGGGGFGGGHFGGGSSGGSHYAPAPARTAPRPASHPSSNASKPATTAAHPISGPLGNAVHTPVFQARGSAGAPLFNLRNQPAAPRTSVIGFPPSDSHMPAVDTSLRTGSGALSFSGQGHQIWQDTPAARGASSMSVSESQRTLFGRNTSFTTRPVPPHRVFPYQPPGFFYPGFYGYYPLGFYGGGLCDPFWGFDSGFGCGFGYGLGFGYGYPGYFGFGYDNSFGVGSYDGPVDYENDTPENGYGDYSPSPEPEQGTGESVAPDASAAAVAPPASASSSPGTVIYFKDGTNLEVLSYWLDTGKLHYITTYNGEMTADMSEVDLQRTVDDNARNGINFTLRPNPPVPAPTTAPAPQPAPDSQPAPQP